MLSKIYLIFGGTGSLGTTLVRRLVEKGNHVIVFSRDEAKHHKLLQKFPHVQSIIGDVRDYDAVLRAIRLYRPNFIINAAAMKQVPICEDHPYEAVMTNVVGTRNIVKAVEELYPHTSEQFYSPKLKVLSVSTDKACKPVNSYGMTKALQERIHMNGVANAVFNCVRYGNVLESTGSVIPVFKNLLKQNQPLTVTDVRMTRFLLSLDQAVDLIFKALEDNFGKRIFVPIVPAAKVMDLAEVMKRRADSDSDILVTGIRPGEKIHEILISEEETYRTSKLDDKTYIIHDFYSVKFLRPSEVGIEKEYSSGDILMSQEELEKILDLDDLDAMARAAHGVVS